MLEIDVIRAWSLVEETFWPLDTGGVMIRLVVLTSASSSAASLGGPVRLESAKCIIASYFSNSPN